MTAVSVIIPAYQAETFISRAVRSVLAQTHTDWEIVIASDDGRDYLATLRAQKIDDLRIRCVSTGGTKTGLSNARNTALRAARYDFIVSLDADDQLRSDALALHVPFIERYGVTYSAIRFVDFHTRADMENCNRFIDSGPKDMEEIFTSTVHAFNTVAFDRSKSPGLHWRTELTHLEDLTFMAQCCDIFDRVYHIAEPLYIYNHRPGSLCNGPQSNQEIKKWFEALQAMLHRGELPFAKPRTVQVFDAFLRNWIELETSLLQALKEGTYTRYQDFLKDHKEKLYRLA